MLIRQRNLLSPFYVFNHVHVICHLLEAKYYHSILEVTDTMRVIHVIMGTVPGYFENRIPLKLALGGVCSLANHSVAYEETQSNRVSDCRDFVCSLFPKAILFYFYFTFRRENSFKIVLSPFKKGSTLKRKKLQIIFFIDKTHSKEACAEKVNRKS